MPRLNTEKDFWDKVEKTESCWNWKGKRSDRGYGEIWFYGKCWRAHRLTYFWQNKVLPEAVCHTCDNPSCVNPAHLFGGTNGTNNTDRHRKGRSNTLKGSAHPNAVLNEEKVKMIRAEYSSGGISQRKLGFKYGVSQTTIEDIVHFRKWSWLK